MPDYNLKIDLSNCEKLDRFALLVDQPYNLGDKGDWFGCFRGGLYGMYARIYGVQFHYKLLHSWESRLTQIRQVDSHASSILFNMDSALECFTFALNGLGWIVEDSLFKNILSESDLRKINPINIVGLQNRLPVPGYSKYFPQFQNHWINSKQLIEKIIEHHDVSKHRESVLTGGQLRRDPPPGYEGVLEIEGKKIPHSPFLIFQELHLATSPKLPSALRANSKREDIDTIEVLVPKFMEFMEISFRLAYEDSVANIKLPEPQFREKDAV